MASAPLTINHIALSVPDIDDAIEWYGHVLGMKLLAPVIEQDRLVDPDLAILQVYPPSLNKVRVAFLTTGQGTNLELYEFQDPKTKPAPDFAQGYNSAGYIHMAITTTDVDGLLKKVLENGGKQVGIVVPAGPYKACYVQDKWGNVIELMDFTFEQVTSLAQTS